MVNSGAPRWLSGKESACNAGDVVSFPGSGRCPGDCVAASPNGSVVKNLPAMQETWVLSLGWEDTLEEEEATHSRMLAWEIPQTEGPGGLQSMGSQRVGHN